MHYHVLFCIYNWNYCGTFVVPKFLLPLETLDFTGVYLLVDFKVGNLSTSLIDMSYVSNMSKLSIPYLIPPIKSMTILLIHCLKVILFEVFLSLIKQHSFLDRYSLKAIQNCSWKYSHFEAIDLFYF